MWCVSETVFVSSVWRLHQGLLSSGKPEDSLTLPHRRETVRVWTRRLQQGFLQCIRPGETSESNTLKWGANRFFHTFNMPKNKEKQTNSMFVSRLSLRNRMCVKSRDAQNATQIQAPYGSMLRRYTGRRRTLPRNSGAITRARRPSPGSLGGTARVARQGNFRWAGIRTKGSTTTLPQNRTIVCRSSLSRQRSPW